MVTRCGSCAPTVREMRRARLTKSPRSTDTNALRDLISAALQEFKTDPSIDVLVMDGVATVGHDLSTVNTIICMESIPKVRIPAQPATTWQLATHLILALLRADRDVGSVSISSLSDGRRCEASDHRHDSGVPRQCGGAAASCARSADSDLDGPVIIHAKLSVQRG